MGDHEHRVLVVGAAGLDLKIRPCTTEVAMGRSNPGEIRWNWGGVARNIAENLAFGHRSTTHHGSRRRLVGTGASPKAWRAGDWYRRVSCRGGPADIVLRCRLQPSPRAAGCFRRYGHHRGDHAGTPEPLAAVGARGGHRLY